MAVLLPGLDLTLLAKCRLIIEEQGDALVLRAAKPFPPTRLEDGLGCAGYSGPAKTPVEMDTGASEALRHEWKDIGSP